MFFRLIVHNLNMTKRMFEMSEKSSEMREAIEIVAGPRGFNDTRESQLARAARRAKVSYRTARALWYGEITDPEHKAARRMTEAARRHGAVEAKELAGKFEIIAAALRITDPDFYSADIAALVNAARILGGQTGT